MRSLLLRAQQGSAIGSFVTWTPANLPSLAAWYKADAGVTTNSGNVTQVLDQSGNGYTLTNAGTVPLNATALNGFPAFNFVGANNAVLKTTLNAFAPGAQALISAFAVASLGAGIAANGRLISYTKNGATQDFDNAGSASLMGRNDASTLQMFSNSGLKGTTTYSGSPQRYGSICDGVNNTMYTNNVAGTPVAFTASWGATGTLCIGNIINQISAFAGPVGEVVVTLGAINSSDRLSLDNYFKSRYGL